MTENAKREELDPVKNGISNGVNKKVDEAWKEAVDKDKGSSGKAARRELPDVTFGLFMSGLMMEALIALGDLENPISKKKELNAPHAKFVIDTLAMLQEKTKNNLEKDEADALEALLYDLRMAFVQKAGK